MKKSLLLSAALLAGASSAFAVVENATYDAIDGYTFRNVVINSYGHFGVPTEAEYGTWKSLESNFASYDYVASATVLGDKVYVATSKQLEGDALVDKGALGVFDAATGDFIKMIKLTVNGADLEGLLCANQVMHDDFGHLIVVGYKGTAFSETGTNPIKPYLVDPETGACTLVADLELTEDDRVYSGRTDFYDCVGDITRKEARCVFMTAAQGGENKSIYAWKSEQGESDWSAHLVGEEYLAFAVEETFPVMEGVFNGGTVISILPDDEYSGSMFYVDDMNCYPALYNSECGLIDSFASVPTTDEGKALYPATNPNGAVEVTVGDATFFIYPFEEYGSQDGSAMSRARVTKYGTVGDMSTLSQCWDFPANGLGEHKGAGRRGHMLEAEKVTDENGKEGAYIFTYKAGNGFARFLLAEPGFTAGVEDAIVSDENAPVEYFNLQGIRVANPENGVYIRRQGAKATKVVL